MWSTLTADVHLKYPENPELKIKGGRWSSKVLCKKGERKIWDKEYCEKGSATKVEGSDYVLSIHISSFPIKDLYKSQEEKIKAS